MSKRRVDLLAEQLRLQPHPEGGFYAETYRSVHLVDTPRGPRPAATAIYFLLTAGNFSAFHRIASDEAWHHYEGDAVHIHVLHGNGHYEVIRLGKDAAAGEVQQALVPGGAWFASEAIGLQGYALVGCTVAPGFDFADFELADRTALAADFPQHRPLVERLSR